MLRVALLEDFPELDLVLVELMSEDAKIPTDSSFSSSMSMDSSLDR